MSNKQQVSIPNNWTGNNAPIGNVNIPQRTTSAPPTNNDVKKPVTSSNQNQKQNNNSGNQQNFQNNNQNNNNQNNNKQNNNYQPNNNQFNQNNNNQRQNNNTGNNNNNQQNTNTNNNNQQNNNQNNNNSTPQKTSPNKPLESPSKTNWNMGGSTYKPSTNFSNTTSSPISSNSQPYVPSPNKSPIKYTNNQYQPQDNSNMNNNMGNNRFNNNNNNYYNNNNYNNNGGYQNYNQNHNGGYPNFNNNNNYNGNQNFNNNQPRFNPNNPQYNKQFNNIPNSPSSPQVSNTQVNTNTPQSPSTTPTKGVPPPTREKKLLFKVTDGKVVTPKLTEEEEKQKREEEKKQKEEEERKQREEEEKKKKEEEEEKRRQEEEKKRLEEEEKKKQEEERKKKEEEERKKKEEEERIRKEEEEKQRKEEERKKKEEEEKTKREIHNNVEKEVGEIKLGPQSSNNNNRITFELDYLLKLNQNYHLIDKPKMDIDLNAHVKDKPQTEGKKYAGTYSGTTKKDNKYSKNNYNNKKKIIKPKTPVLKTTDNGWKSNRQRPKEEVDKDEEVIKQVRDWLNKLTFETFNKISGKIQTTIDNIDTLRNIVKVIFDKAVTENFFCSLYAELCKILQDKFPSFTYIDENNTEKEETFKKFLLNTCQKEFEKTTQEPEGLSKQEFEDWRVLNKRLTLGNIRFIGELFKLEMLGSNIMHICIKQLLDCEVDKPNEEDLEQLCKLIENVGAKLDTEKAKVWMDQYFHRLISMSKNVSNRVRFMVEDLVSLRNSKWISVKSQAKEIINSSSKVASPSPKKITVLKRDNSSRVNLNQSNNSKPEKKYPDIDFSKAKSDFEEYFENQEAEDLEDYISKSFKKTEYAFLFGEAIIDYSGDAKKLRKVIDLFTQSYEELKFKKEDFTLVVDYLLYKYPFVYRDSPRLADALVTFFLQLFSSFPEVINMSLFNKEEFLALRNLSTKSSLACVGVAAKIFGSCCEELMDDENFKENLKKHNIKPSHYLKDDSSEEDLEEFFREFEFDPSFFQEANPIDIVKKSFKAKKSATEIVKELKETVPEGTLKKSSFVGEVMDGVIDYLTSTLGRTTYKPTDELGELLEKEASFWKDYNTVVSSFSSQDDSRFLVLDRVSIKHSSENYNKCWIERFFQYLLNYNIVRETDFNKWSDLVKSKSDHKKSLDDLSPFFKVLNEKKK